MTSVNVTYTYREEDTFSKKIQNCEIKELLRVPQFWARSNNCEERILALQYPSVCPAVTPSVRLSAWNNSAHSEWVFMKFSIWLLLPKYVAKIQVWLKSDKNNWYFRWRRIYILIIFLLRMRNVSDKSGREDQNTHFMFNNFLFSKNHTVYKKMWRITLERVKLRKKIWCTRIACWLPKATDTHSEYVMLIAFPLQQWLRERAWMIRYNYIACLVWFYQTPPST